MSNEIDVLFICSLMHMKSLNRLTCTITFPLPLESPRREIIYHLGFTGSLFISCDSLPLFFQSKAFTSNLRAAHSFQLMRSILNILGWCINRKFISTVASHIDTIALFFPSISSLLDAVRILANTIPLVHDILPFSILILKCVKYFSLFDLEGFISLLFFYHLTFAYIPIEHNLGV